MSKILFVEDDKSLVGEVCERLGLWHEVEHLKAEEIRSNKDVDYDLLVINAAAPQREGLELRKMLEEAGKKAPVLILSETNDPADETDKPREIECLLDSQEEMIHSPYDADKLSARIAAILRREHPTEHIIQTGDIRLDLVSRTMFIGKDEVELSMQEFQLYEYLVNRPEIYFSMEDLLIDLGWEKSLTGEDVHEYLQNIRSHFERYDRPCPISIYDRNCKFSLVPGRI